MIGIWELTVIQHRFLKQNLPEIGLNRLEFKSHDSFCGAEYMEESRVTTGQAYPGYYCEW